jgi:UDP:flavonoid glycosyltransferase YjiC (YdhE family)
MVTIPLAAVDNHINAARVERLGAGIAANEADRSAETIREAVLTVLKQPGHRTAAQSVAAEMQRSTGW